MTDRPCFLKKLVCGVLTVTITALPFPHVVWAGDNSDTQRFNDAVGQGTSTARQMKNELEKELKKALEAQ